MAKAKKPQTDAEMVEDYIFTKDYAKALYQKADEILNTLARRTKCKPIKLTDGREAVVINQYRGKTLVWAHAAARKYDLEVRRLATSSESA